MISDEESEKLKELLKNDYTADVLQTLRIKNVTNSNGNEYSRGMVTNVLNGVREHKEIEEALFEVYEERKLAIEKEKERRRQILAS